MEDHFDKLLYLVVGVVYFFLNKAKNRDAGEQPMTDHPPKYRPAPAASTDWENTWASDTQEAPVEKSLLQTSIAKRPLLPEHHTATHPAAQKPQGKKIDRVLRRYGGWKKAVIMGELIQPYS
jgi:hypothetical protein